MAKIIQMSTWKYEQMIKKAVAAGKKLYEHDRVRQSHVGWTEEKDSEFNQAYDEHMEEFDTCSHLPEIDPVNDGMASYSDGCCGFEDD